MDSTVIDTGSLRLTYGTTADGKLVGVLDCCEGSWSVVAANSEDDCGSYEVAVRPFEDDPTYINENVDLPPDVEFTLIGLLADLLEERPCGQSR